MRDSLTLARQPYWRNASLAGLQSAAAAAIALPLVYLSPWSHLIGYAALGTLVALFGRYAPARARNRILLLATLTQTLAVFVMSATGWLGMALAAKLLLLTLACGIFFFVAVAGRFGPPGPLIFIFAAGAAMRNPTSLLDVLERSAITAAVALLAWAICAATEHFRHHPLREDPPPPNPAHNSPDLLIASTRSAVAAGIAAFTSYAFGAAYPFWAAMGALAVLQGAHLHIGMNRALQRMAGTVAGAILVWLILAQNPSFWVVFAILVVLQYVTEVIIGFNYGLGQILVTPMALLMTRLAVPGVDGTAMVSERILDTLLGAAIGITIAVLWSSLEERRQLARHAEHLRKSA
ncbi:MAG TPA: FUSC family protein [Sphingobium sp.]|nr:FUSC family protein [Sphingobium sp.]